MEILKANITPGTAELLKDIVKHCKDFQSVNLEVEKISGIVDFFSNPGDYFILKDELDRFKTVISDYKRKEYGDFQTPSALTDKICLYLHKKKINPAILIEPTCGKGNFILSSMKSLSSIEKIYAIEIYKPYVWECKFNIIDFLLNNPGIKKKQIYLFQESIFNFNLMDLKKKMGDEELLILGNPPWITNSTLTSLKSGNMPNKSNFKRHNGFDAITGKGNFDISEYISLLLLEHFSNKNGHFAFLMKSSIIKNIVYDLTRNRYRTGSLEKLNIDAKKEFNVAVDASLFYCRFNKENVYQCKENDFYLKNFKNKIFGWVENKFVADVKRYQTYKSFDGTCPLEWRSGIKHDCSKIMELKKINGKYINKLKECIALEEDIIFEFLKSSDLKKRIITNSDLYTIVTQKKIGQDTSYIKKNYPLTYRYLEKKEKLLEERKSSIYKNKPRFSIFGVGDYSFKKYKVAISGLYKDGKFSLILPEKEKPILLDDTCYFLGFDNPGDAFYTFFLLNNQTTQNLIKSLVFLDDKRVYTKDLLMRIDLNKIAENISFDEIKKNVSSSFPGFAAEISQESWEQYLKNITDKEKEDIQLSLF